MVSKARDSGKMFFVDLGRRKGIFMVAAAHWVKIESWRSVALGHARKIPRGEYALCHAKKKPIRWNAAFI